MRSRLIVLLKSKPWLTHMVWTIAKMGMKFIGVFIHVRENSVVFASFGGRKYDDSPRAIYEEMLSREEFRNWSFTWAFVNPDEYNIPVGDKVKIDTLKFFITLLKCKVWVSNSGMDRGIDLNKKNVIRVETWHGTPIKRIGGEENQNSIGGKRRKGKRNLDARTIRCSQSEYDRDIFSRVFEADPEAFLMCDLPRNDKLFSINQDMCNEIKEKLSIPKDKKVILYMPTYREYLIDENRKTYLNTPINFDMWREKLADKYVLLIRAHYAVMKELNICEDYFVRDVSAYAELVDLYCVTDILISDYSSALFDYSLLDRPMLCYAYDYDEYEEKRGLYVDIEKILPCPVDKREEDILEHIQNVEKICSAEKLTRFRNSFVPHAGKASETVVDVILNRIRNSR